jgi:hypothetical protein
MRQYNLRTSAVIIKETFGMTAEEIRLAESGAKTKHWKRWGPYLSERAWGTVREDYSANGTALSME